MQFVNNESRKKLSYVDKVKIDSSIDIITVIKGVNKLTLLGEAKVNAFIALYGNCIALFII